MTTLAISIAIGLVMLAAEQVWPGVKQPRVPRWLARAIAINLFQILTVIVAGVTWNRWLQGWSLFSCYQLSPWFGALLAYIASTFVFYWWHRVRHESPFWWRVAHQIHHSATRIEVLAAFYKHPFEIIINSMLSAIVVLPLMGCSTEQSGLYTILIALGELFYHWNVHTPRWIGRVFQRPESHRIHHQRDRHTKNYSDLAVWDQLWDTYSNPTNGDRIECGFPHQQETQLPAMLALKEVNTTRLPEPLDWRICCLGCDRRHRCDKDREAP